MKSKDEYDEIPDSVKESWVNLHKKICKLFIVKPHLLKTHTYDELQRLFKISIRLEEYEASAIITNEMNERCP